MTPNNFDTMLKAFQKRHPFRPFSVVLMNGDRFRVDHPEALIVRGGKGVYIAKDDEMWIFDHEGVTEFTDHRRTTSRN